MKYFRSNKENKIYFDYTCLFFIMFSLCCLIYFLLYNKTFFRSYDGFDQHYFSFLILGRSIREFFKNLFVNHQFYIPMWDSSIGYGADTITSYSAYLYDPFNWISAFFSENLAEYGYALMVMLKFYVCGFAFMIFAKNKGCKPISSLCGALIYVFSATMYVGFYQPFFINPLYIFPILMIGVDKLFEGNGNVLYVAALAIAFINYFYFAYMMCILILVYCIIKVIFTHNITFNVLVKKVIRFIVNSIFTGGIAMFALLPTVLVMIGANRLTLSHYLPLHFTKQYYYDLFTGFITFYDMGQRDCRIGFSIIALILCMYLLISKKKYMQQKVELLLATICLCVPYIGHVMNGFNYTANRWMFAYNLFVAYIVSLLIPEYLNEKKTNKVVVLIGVLIYCLIGIIGNSSVEYLILCGVLLLITLLISFVKIREKMVLLITCFSVILYSFFYFNSNFGNNLIDNIEVGKAFATLKESSGISLVEQLSTNDNERYDTKNINVIKNSSQLIGKSGMNFYISIYNENINRFNQNLAIVTSPESYGYRGLNNRSELEVLMGVNHFITDITHPKCAYGYNIVEGNNDKVISYKIGRNNSLFYLFDKSISYDDYNLLNPLEKQEVLLQSIVIDESKNTLADLVINNNLINSNVVYMEGVNRINDITFEVTEGGYLVLNTEEVKNSEIYVYFKNIDYNYLDKNTYAIYTQGAYNNQKLPELFMDFGGNNDKSHMYGGKHNWLLNLGYSDNPMNQIIISFMDTGIYTVDSIEVYARNNEEIDANIYRLNQQYISAGKIKNRFEVSLQANKDQYLFTSIPYSSGWQCHVDGKSVNIMKADDAFMAIEIEKGNHEIEFKYITPGLREGVVISLFSFLLFVFFRKRVL